LVEKEEDEKEEEEKEEGENKEEEDDDKNKEDDKEKDDKEEEEGKDDEKKEKEKEDDKGKLYFIISKSWNLVYRPDPYTFHANPDPAGHADLCGSGSDITRLCKCYILEKNWEKLGKMTKLNGFAKTIPKF